MSAQSNPGGSDPSRENSDPTTSGEATRPHTETPDPETPDTETPDTGPRADSATPTATAASEGDAIPRPVDTPRLTPRPLYRPTVDPGAAAAFGRPAGTDGSFLPTPGGATTLPVAPPRDPVLAEAFGRPRGDDTRLQRPPVADAPAVPDEPADPWRDPDSAARLGAPVETLPAAPPADAPRLTARDVIFGHRIDRRAAATLVAIALAIGLAGGGVVALVTSDRDSVTSRSVTLHQSTSDNSDVTRVGEIADAVLPAVVSIEVANDSEGGTGSGVVIDGAGYIVTNNHVVSLAANDDSASVQVTFDDGQRVPARIVGRDTKTDLAVVKVDNVRNLRVAELGSSGDVQVGDDVIAVGSPLGLSKTVTRGIVSALHRPVPLAGEGTDTDAVIDAVQTDASINPGNSGGPLIDDEGRVIGINSAIYSETGGSVGLGFAIPIDQVTAVAQTLIRDGRVTHPEFGLNTRSVVNEVTSGAQVANVRDGSPAQAAGIVEGDVVTRIGDRDVTTADEYVVAMRATTPDQPVTVTLVRDGRSVDVQVTPRAE